MTGGAPPPGTPAIDMAAGVARVMGDRGMFERVLARFRSQYGDAAGSIRAAVSTGDASLAERIAHTLKGAAGMIEARALQQQALAVELATRSRVSDLELQIERLDMELDKVMRAVDAVLAATPADDRCQSREPAAETLERLRALLDVGDGAALDLLAHARGSLAGALGAARFGELEAAVNAFDFERALGLLAQPLQGPGG